MPRKPTPADIREAVAAYFKCGVDAVADEFVIGYDAHQIAHTMVFLQDFSMQSDLSEDCTVGDFIRKNCPHYAII